MIAAEVAGHGPCKDGGSAKDVERIANKPPPFDRAPTCLLVCCLWSRQQASPRKARRLFRAQCDFRGLGKVSAVGLCVKITLELDAKSILLILLILRFLLTAKN